MPNSALCLRLSLVWLFNSVGFFTSYKPQAKSLSPKVKELYCRCVLVRQKLPNPKPLAILTYRLNPDFKRIDGCLVQASSQNCVDQSLLLLQGFQLRGMYHSTTLQYQRPDLSKLPLHDPVHSVAFTGAY